MRNLKRFLAMTLTMLMVTGCFSVMAVSADFDDVVKYQDQINLLTTLGIVAGKADGKFGYGEDVQRYQMALFVARAATGKVGNDYVNWYETENYTGFNDVKADHYLGAISYAAENGIIKGYSDAKGNTDKFGPADGIKIQDVFTMAVRMLGYGSKAMDSNYPWSYIDKAIELGLDKDLAASYNNEDVATREETVVILYNALFARKTDGTTIAQVRFNLTQANVVISGNAWGNLYAGGGAVSKTQAGEGYVAFNLVSSAGGIETTPTYWLPVSNFGMKQGDQNTKIGYSYNVLTRDNFASLIYAKENPSAKFDQSKTTVGAPSAPTSTSNAVTIGGNAYKVVKNYTNLYNTFVGGYYGKNQNFEREIVLHRLNGQDFTAGGTSYVYDANYNILDYYGNILLYWVPHSITGQVVNTNAGIGSANGRYLYKIAGGAYIEPDDSIWARAAKVGSAATYGVRDILDTIKDIYKVNAYADTIIFDDNNDGTFDRGVYTSYSFGFLDYETTDKDPANGNLRKNPVIRPHNTAKDEQSLKLFGSNLASTDNYKNAGFRYFNADGVLMTATEVAALFETPKDKSLSRGNYVLYSYNATTRMIFIKKVFEPVVGLVTTVDMGYTFKYNQFDTEREAKITFDQVYYNLYAGNISGTTFHLGNAQLPGARFSDVATYVDLASLQGKTVHYILAEEYGDVLAVYEAQKNGRYVVYDSFVGMTSTGYLQALVYDMSNARTAMTIASVDGLWYTGNVYASSLFGFNLKKGDLLYVETDALGISHVDIVDPNSGYNYYYTVANSDSARLYFSNGIINTLNEGWFEYNNGVAQSTTFKKFQTSAQTVIIVERADGTLSAYVGIPAEGASIALANWTNGRAQVFVQTELNKDINREVAKLIYVKDGEFSGTVETGVTNTGWANNSASTIIYVDANAAASQLATNQIYTGLTVTLGATYQYSYVIDFIRGGLTTVYTGASFNQALQAGCFYRVVDGYVTEKINVTNDSDVRIGMLAYIDNYYSVLIKNVYDNMQQQGYDYSIIENQAHILYKLLAGNDIRDLGFTGVDKFVPYDYLVKEPSIKDTINTQDNYTSVYYYAGSDFANVPTRVYIFQESKIGDITAANTFAAKSGSIQYPTIGELYNTPLLGFRPYVGQDNTAKQTRYFEIPYEAYMMLSAHDTYVNDNGNTVFAGVGSTMRLYQGAAFIQSFNEANVTVATLALTTTANGTRYFLEIAGSTALEVPASDTTTDTFELVWTNPNSSTTYKLTGLNNVKVQRTDAYNVNVYVDGVFAGTEDMIPPAYVYGTYSFALSAEFLALVGNNAYGVFYNGQELFPDASGMYTIPEIPKTDIRIDLIKRGIYDLDFNLEIIPILWTRLEMALSGLLTSVLGTEIYDELAQVEITIGTDVMRISSLSLYDLFNNIIPTINTSAYAGARVVITLPKIELSALNSQQGQGALGDFGTYEFVLTSNDVQIQNEEILVSYNSTNGKFVYLFNRFSFTMPQKDVDVNVNVQKITSRASWTIAPLAKTEPVSLVARVQTFVDYMNGNTNYVEYDLKGATIANALQYLNPGDVVDILMDFNSSSAYRGEDFDITVKIGGVALHEGYVLIDNNNYSGGSARFRFVVPDADIAVGIAFIG